MESYIALSKKSIGVLCLYVPWVAATRILRTVNFVLHKRRSDDVLVYCDARQSVRQIRYIEGTPVEHRPPARPDANTIVERKIGLALS